MEQVPYSVMLLRSMIMDVLDQVERVAPAVIPESLLDSEPVMNEISAPKIQSKKNKSVKPESRDQKLLKKSVLTAILNQKTEVESDRI
jgi:hypothetical protein